MVKRAGLVRVGRQRTFHDGVVVRTDEKIDSSPHVQEGSERNLLDPCPRPEEEDAKSR